MDIVDNDYAQQMLRQFEIGNNFPNADAGSILTHLALEPVAAKDSVQADPDSNLT